MLVRLIVAVSATAVGASSAGPPTDEEVLRAGTRYNERIKQMQADGTFTPMTLGPLADEVLQGIDIASMSQPQIEKLIDSTNIHYYTTRAAAFDERLAALGAAPTLEGARAAIARLSFLNAADAERQRAVIAALLDHPNAAEALQQAELWGHFRIFGWSIDAAAVKGLTTRLVSLGAQMPESMTVLNAATAAPALFDIVAAAGASPAEREPLRARIVAVMRLARERFDPADPSLKNISFGGIDAGQYLDSQVRRLEGPSARGTLVGGPAPELTFQWSSADQRLAALADLRGKVVVLDFWATWCGPCVASFPKMREAAARYKGFGVEIIGVTSLQGSHHQGGKTIDCKGDPDRERALMADYVKAGDIAWTVAFTKEPVFNPDYGVRGIPHVVIIDAKGVVRHEKLGFHGDPTRLYAAIDGLLAEAGLPVPTP